MRADADRVRSDFAALTKALSVILSNETPKPDESVVTEGGDETASIMTASTDAGVETQPVVEEEAPKPDRRVRGDPPSRDVILRAISSAPGLANAAPDELELLTAELEQGVCAVDALQEVFGQVNRQTLVSLIREIGPC